MTLYPDFCLSVLLSTINPSTGAGQIIAIRRGEKGYYPTTYGQQTREWLRFMNERLDVNAAMQDAFEVCSINGGWDNLETIYNRFVELASLTV